MHDGGPCPGLDSPSFPGASLRRREASSGAQAKLRFLGGLEAPRRDRSQQRGEGGSPPTEVHHRRGNAGRAGALKLGSDLHHRRLQRVYGRKPGEESLPTIAFVPAPPPPTPLASPGEPPPRQ